MYAVISEKRDQNAVLVMGNLASALMGTEPGLVVPHDSKPSYSVDWGAKSGSGISRASSLGSSNRYRQLPAEADLGLSRPGLDMDLMVWIRDVVAEVVFWQLFGGKYDLGVVQSRYLLCPLPFGIRFESEFDGESKA